MKSIESQVTLMSLHWPRFEVTGRTRDLAIWEGPLAGIEVEYWVSVSLGLPKVGMQTFYRRMPRVEVLYPALKPNWAAAEEAPLPHVYLADDLPRSPLCLFDPRKVEWSHADYLALTTIPWAADWLCCYEIWRATGHWTGGGRHGDRRLEEAA